MNSNMFPAGGSTSDLVVLRAINGKLVPTPLGRVVKGKDGLGTLFVKRPDGTPVIRPNVYRLPTKAELKAAGVDPKVLGTPGIIPHLISVATYGTPLIQKAA